MIPPELIAQYRTVQVSATTLVSRDLLAVWRNLDFGDAAVATTALLPIARDLTAAYGDVVAISAADFYDGAREGSRARGRFVATPAPVAPVAQVDAAVRWAVTPLWSTEPRTDVALTKMVGSLERLVLQPGRDTVLESGRRDPMRARFAREPQGNACEFCLMLASRGGVYRIDEVAQFHDRCACVMVPVWSDDDLPEVNRRLSER